MIDDEPDMLEVSKAYLESGGLFEVDTSLSAVETLRFKDIERYDAIVCDYQMPEMDGIEFLRELREHGIKVPFILFTGKSREDVAIKALNAGADFYLKKGPDVKAMYAELCNFIDHAVARYVATNAIEHNLNRFQKLLESTPELVEVVDSNHIIRYVNSAVERLFGKRPEEFIGTKIQTSLSEPESLEGILNSLLEGKLEEAKVLVKARHIDGSIRLLDATITRFLNGRFGAELIFKAKEAPMEQTG
jgi:PAS domain S-box-containing protein